LVNISFEQNLLNPEQEKIVAKLIKEAKKFFKTDQLDYIKYGLNPKSVLDELDQMKEGKDKKELKAIETRKSNIVFETNLTVKVVFNFKTKLRQIVFRSGIMPTEKYFANCNTWTALLDFPTLTPLLFGRAHKEPAFHKGEYFFAPLDTSLFGDLFTKIDRHLFELSAAEPTIDILEKIRYSKESFDQMKTMLQLVKKKQPTGITLIDKFNSNGHLTGIMKKVPHFGNSMNLIYRFVSEVDVSTICIPLRSSTLIQMADFGLAHRNVLEALYALSSALEEFAIEPAESSRISSEIERPRTFSPPLESARSERLRNSSLSRESSSIEGPESSSSLRDLSIFDMPESSPPSTNGIEEKKENPIYAFDLLQKESRQSTNDLSISEEPMSKAIDFKLDDDPQKRIQQIDGLRKEGSPQAVRILIQILLNDKDSGVRVEAATALGMTGDRLLIPILRRALNVDNDYDVRAAAAEAIELIQRISK
jgi:HEAT repeats